MIVEPGALLAEIEEPLPRASWLVNRITRYFELSAKAEIGQKTEALRARLDALYGDEGFTGVRVIREALAAASGSAAFASPMHVGGDPNSMHGGMLVGNAGACRNTRLCGTCF